MGTFWTDPILCVRGPTRGTPPRLAAAHTRSRALLRRSARTAESRAPASGDCVTLSVRACVCRSAPPAVGPSPREARRVAPGRLWWIAHEDRPSINQKKRTDSPRRPESPPPRPPRGRAAMASRCACSRRRLAPRASAGRPSGGPRRARPRTGAVAAPGREALRQRQADQVRARACACAWTRPREPRGACGGARNTSAARRARHGARPSRPRVHRVARGCGSQAAALRAWVSACPEQGGRQRVTRGVCMRWACGDARQGAASGRGAPRGPERRGRPASQRCVCVCLSC